MGEKELFKLASKEFYEIEKIDISVFDDYDGCFDYFVDKEMTTVDLSGKDYFIIETPHLDITVWNDGGIAVVDLRVTLYENREAGLKMYSDILIDDIEEALADDRV